MSYIIIVSFSYSTLEYVGVEGEGEDYGDTEEDEMNYDAGASSSSGNRRSEQIRVRFNSFDAVRNNSYNYTLFVGALENRTQFFRG